MERGLKVNPIIAIDFTASNGDPRNPNSYHYIKNPTTMNEYQASIVTILDIIMQYCQTQMVPMFGFGAQMLNSNSLETCFPLTFDCNNPFVYGWEQAVQVYHSALSNIILSGPTFFAPIIQQSRQTAEILQENDSSKILILIFL